MTLCEENCYLIDYNNITKKVKCSCKVKLSLPLIEDIVIDTNQLYQSFTDINYFANIKMMKCFNEVLNINDLKRNCGFIIIFTIIISFFVVLFLFLLKYYGILKLQIEKIVTAKKKSLKEEEPKNILNRRTSGENRLIKQENDVGLKSAVGVDECNGRKKENEIVENEGVEKSEGDNDKIKKRKRKRGKSPKNKKKKQIKNKRIQNLSPKGNTILHINDHLTVSPNSILELNNENKKEEEILSFTDCEINKLPYEEALEKDKRTFVQYYFSLLRTNHLFIFTFLNNKDYNSKIVKIFLFIFSFSLNLTVNAMFFNDETMHKIYIDKGSYNFIYQLPQIIYSSLISVIINFIIKILALSDKDVIKLKRVKRKQRLDEVKNKLLKKLTIKFCLFFILAFFLLLGFWTFITCFCGVYKNTRINFYLVPLLASFCLLFILLGFI